MIENPAEVWQEIGLFGREGAGELTSLLSNSPSPNLVVMQVTGEGYGIDAGMLKSLFRSNDEIQELLLAYVEAFTFQVAQAAIANSRLAAAQRLARWLLMIQDRVQADRFHLTHEYIAAMLGVARVSVTLALRELEAAEAIITSRKSIEIVSRSSLIDIAQRNYGEPERYYVEVMAARTHRHDPA